MNLIEMSEQLKDVPDQLLMKEVQFPSGAYPSYLVVTEIVRRKRMRDQAMKEAPSTTVVQDLMQPSREQIMAAVAATRGGMALSSQPESPEALLQAQQISQPLPRLGSPGIMAAPQAAQAMAAQDVMGAQEPLRMAGGGPVAFSDGGMPKYDNRGVPRFQEGGSYDEGLSAIMTQIESPSEKEERLKKEAEDARRLSRAKDANIPWRIEKSTRLSDADSTPTKKAGSATTPAAASTRVERYAVTPPVFNKFVDPYANNAKALLDKFNEFEKPTPDRLELERLGEEIRYRRKVPFRYGFLEENLTKREEDMPGRRASNINEALIQAGLGIMGSRSPRFLQAASEGGTAGLNAYRQGLKDIREGERDILQSKTALANAQTLYDQNKFAAGDRALDRAKNEYESGLNRLNTESAILANNQNQALQIGQLNQQGQVFEFNAKIAAAKLQYELDALSEQARHYRRMNAYGGAAANRVSDADQKAAADEARMLVEQDQRSALMSGKPLSSAEYQALYNQYYAKALQRRADGINYQPPAPDGMSPGWSYKQVPAR